MSEPCEVIHIVKLKSFKQFHYLLQQEEKQNQHSIVHVDFNLLACQSVGIEILNKHEIEYEVIFYDHAKPSYIIDMFYDHEYKIRNNKQYDYDPTPDYNSLIVENNFSDNILIK